MVDGGFLMSLKKSSCEDCLSFIEWHIMTHDWVAFTATQYCARLESLSLGLGSSPATSLPPLTTSHLSTKALSSLAVHSVPPNLPLPSHTPNSIPHLT